MSAEFTGGMIARSLILTAGLAVVYFCLWLRGQSSTVTTFALLATWLNCGVFFISVREANSVRPSCPRDRVFAFIRQCLVWAFWIMCARYCASAAVALLPHSPPQVIFVASGAAALALVLASQLLPARFGLRVPPLGR